MPIVTFRPSRGPDAIGVMFGSNCEVVNCCCDDVVVMQPFRTGNNSGMV